MSSSPYNAFRLPLPSTEEEDDSICPAFSTRTASASTRQMILHFNAPSYCWMMDHGGDDPFFLAAAHGTINCLEFMLEFWQSAGGFSQTDPELPSPNARDFGLLHTACASAQVEIVKLLLSSSWQAHFGDVRAADIWSYTPLRMASGSLPPIPKSPRAGRYFTAQEHIARSEGILSPEENDDLLDQAKKYGKTPRQNRQETQGTWRREEQEQMDWEMKMARGRGQPRS
ncbi:hypothetical protein VPNG_09536 [Cytospora leucostoma]|uniref:Uncharacterized protein n=1 Tax=Cytospora leucostoma TaxID=1230097 RepID=A0A423VQE0_9PEZI|nr:hypothetical protein VPNG_09536 [Cytospora leucostoma]